MLALGFARAGAALVNVFTVLLVLGWMTALIRNWGGADNTALVFALLAITAGALLDVGVGWLSAALAFALVGWDLQRYAAWLERADKVIAEEVLIQQHLLRFGIVLGGGLVVGSIVRIVSFDLSFGWVMVLAFIALVLLGWAVTLVRRQSSSSQK